MDDETAAAAWQTPEQELHGLRMGCLHLAQQCHPSGTDAKALIYSAKELEAYVTGKADTDTPTT